MGTTAGAARGDKFFGDYFVEPTRCVDCASMERFLSVLSHQRVFYFRRITKDHVLRECTLNFQPQFKLVFVTIEITVSSQKRILIASSAKTLRTIAQL